VGELRGSDLPVVRAQLGREPTTPFTVVARCPDGHPLVTRNHPVDAAGRPFPTLFWLTCSEARSAVSRLESGGAIGRLNERVDADGTFAARLIAAHEGYAVERARFVPEARSWGGVGGTRTGVKCLHAHYAYHLAGGDDPVGSWVAEQVEPVHEEHGGRVAVIDQGTNSIRLLVAEPEPNGGLRELARDMVITRLGKGVDETGRIAPEALQRTVDVLAMFCRRARALHAERIRVGATSAVRDAANRDEYADEVRSHAGSALEILTGEQEAALSFLGATAGLEGAGFELERPFLVLDIGGGSTEFVLGSVEPSGAVSTQIGSVRLTERFLTIDPSSTEELEAMAAAVEIVLDEVEAALPMAEVRTFVAVAGTATTVQALSLELPFYDPEWIHRTWLSLETAERVLADLARMTNVERAALPVMAPGRGDVIVAGALVLVRVMRRFGFERALVSETDFLDGLALEILLGSG
jgi:exopolyphosphatase/guanosine-5'-triphosphate,3'-diphosphate pyrophosphatase